GLAKGGIRRAFDLDQHRGDDPLFPFTSGQMGSGANMAFRRSALEEVGGFDPALGVGTPTRGGDAVAALFDVIVAGGLVVDGPAAYLHSRRRMRVAAEVGR